MPTIKSFADLAAELESNYSIVSHEIESKRHSKLEASDSPCKENIKIVHSYKARTLAKNTQKQRVSRELKIAKTLELLSVSCPDTGICSFLSVPAIPGITLIYNHPLSDLPNSRGMARQDTKYLLSLDSSILAGILIVLASDYNLFIYQPADSGAQKNAILRTVQKITLVNAIKIVEDMIHSGNHFYIPKLSLIFDTELENGGFENRMQAWLKLVVDSIYQPDTTVYDENLTVKDQTKKFYKAIDEGKKLESITLRKNEKKLKEDCKSALAMIKQLFKEDKISSRLRIALGGIFQEFQLLTMEEGARRLLTTKLTDLNDTRATTLASILNADRGDLVAKNSPADDFFSDMEADSTLKAKTVSIIAKDAETVRIVEIASVAPESEAPNMIVINLSDKYYEVSVEYNSLSFIEKVRANKSLIAGTYPNGKLVA